MEQDLINYYLQCYQADSRSILFSNIFDKSISKRYFIEPKEELINEMLPKVHIPDEHAIDITFEQQLKGNSVQLYYCSFLVTGILYSFKKVEKKACAPLFYFPAEIRKEGEGNFHYIHIDKERLQINYAFLQRIKSKDSQNLYLDIEALKAKPIGIGSLNHLKDFLNKHIENIDTDELFQFPELLNEKQLKSNMRIDKLRKQEKYKLIPASCLCLMDYQEKSSGILNELKILSKTKPSPLLKDFLSIDHNHSPKEEGDPLLPLVPGILNRGQQQLIGSIQQSKRHILIGPPGTGKSYSIAALAIDHIARGKSVLICSKNTDALKVIAKKIEKDFHVKNTIVKAETQSYKSFLKKTTNRLFQKKHTYSEKSTLASLHSKLLKIENEINTLHNTFQTANKNAYKWGGNLSKNDPNWIDHLHRILISYQNKKQTPHWKLADELFVKIKERSHIIRRIITRKKEQNIDHTLKNDYQNISRFHQLLKSSDFYEKEKIRAEINFKAILNIFSVWLVPLDELHEVLPLDEGLFDLLIIDEASQCNISSCLPAIYRSQKLVFSGDPAQLRHVSFLSQNRMGTYRVKNNLPKHSILNYRKNSVLDIALYNTPQHSIYKLNEHFRSLKPIISFSNEHFYDNELVLMTETPDKNTDDVLQFFHCEGSRDKTGANEKEAQAILQSVKKIIDEQIIKDLPQSIGILSPIRAQVTHIKNLISREICYQDLKRHNISVGTAFQFQGDERDCMLLSLCATPECKSGTFTHLNKSDLFNVSITRARYQQKIFHSVGAKDLPTNHILQKYLSLSSKRKTSSLPTKPKEIRDFFAQEISKSVEGLAIECYEQYPIGGIQIDVLLKKGTQYLAIDLIGFPGSFHDAFDIERYMLMYRLNIPILPLSYSNWFFEQEKAIDLIKYYF